MIDGPKGQFTEDGWVRPQFRHPDRLTSALAGTTVQEKGIYDGTSSVQKRNEEAIVWGPSTNATSTAHTTDEYSQR